MGARFSHKLLNTMHDVTCSDGESAVERIAFYALIVHVPCG